MRKRMMTVVAAAALAAGAAVSTAPVASAAADGRAPAAAAQAAHPGSSVNRNVRRVPAGALAADVQYSPGRSSTTLPIDCTITEPVVIQHETTYPFSFLPGDHVVVNAGGCIYGFPPSPVPASGRVGRERSGNAVPRPTGGL